MTTENMGARAQPDASAIANDAADKLKKYIELRSQSSKNTNATLDRLQRHIATLNAQARQRDEHIEQLNQERNQLQAQFDELSRRSEADKTKHASEIKSLKESISDLSSKIEGELAEKAKLSEDLAKAQADLEAARKKIGELEKAMTALQTENDAKVAKVMAAADRGKRAMKLEHDEEIEKLQAQLRERNGKNNKLEVTNKALREEIANLAALTTALQNMIDTLFESEISSPEGYESSADVAKGMQPVASAGGTVREQVSQSSFREAGHVAPVVPMKIQG